MNVSLQNIDKVSALLTVKIEKADYEDKVIHSLKSIRQKAQVPGFRKGMVPMSLIQKMYRKSVLAEEINKMLPEGIYGYINENNIKILGDPMPNEEKQADIDFDTMEDFEFIFDVALSPEVEITVTAKDKVDYYTVELTDEMLEDQIKIYTQRAGHHDKVESYQGSDMLKGRIAELDAEGNTKEDGIVLDDTVLMPSYMKDEEQKAIFDGAKINDVLVFNPLKAYEGNEAEIASLLDIDKAEVSNTISNFSFQIEEITRFVAGELNQDLFDQIFGEGVVNSEEEFRAKVKEQLETQLVASSDYRLMVDARKVLVEKVGKVELPDALLKRSMRLTNADKGENFVDENYDKSVEELIWHLIREKLVAQFELKVDHEDLVKMGKKMAHAQFSQYGMLLPSEDLLEMYVKQMMGKRETIEDLVYRSLDEKLADQLKTIMKLNKKTVSLEELNNLYK